MALRSGDRSPLVQSIGGGGQAGTPGEVHVDNQDSTSALSINSIT